MSESLKNEVVECPYNKCHRVMKSRLQMHVIKCAAAHSGEKMQVCPFNATHRVKEPLFQHHIATCEDRRLVELSKYCIESGEMHGHLAIAPYTAPILPPDVENWDDNNAPTYDPGPVTLDREVLRSFRMIGMGEQQSKSKRMAFRHEEHLRISKIQEGIPISREASFIPPSKPVPVLPDNIPLRQPRQPTYVGPINPSLGLGRGVGRAKAADSPNGPNQQPDQPGPRPEENMLRLAAYFQQISVGRGTSLNSPNPRPGLENLAVGRGVAIPYTKINRVPPGYRQE